MTLGTTRVGPTPRLPSPTDPPTQAGQSRCPVNAGWQHRPDVVGVVLPTAPQVAPLLHGTRQTSWAEP